MSTTKNLTKHEAAPVRAEPIAREGEGRAAAGVRFGIVNDAQHVSLVQLAAARDARRAPTPAEALAWNLVRDRRCLRLKFRREQVVKGFRVDLYCAALRVAVEIDGDVHDDTVQHQRDLDRSEAMAKHGIRVVRLRNNEVSLDALETLLRPLLL